MARKVFAGDASPTFKVTISAASRGRPVMPSKRQSPKQSARKRKCRCCSMSSGGAWWKKSNRPCLLPEETGLRLHADDRSIVDTGPEDRQFVLGDIVVDGFARALPAEIVIHDDDASAHEFRIKKVELRLRGGVPVRIQPKQRNRSIRRPRGKRFLDLALHKMQTRFRIAGGQKICLNFIDSVGDPIALSRSPTMLAPTLYGGFSETAFVDGFRLRHAFEGV